MRLDMSARQGVILLLKTLGAFVLLDMLLVLFVPLWQGTLAGSGVFETGFPLFYSLLNGDVPLFPVLAFGYILTIEAGYTKQGTDLFYVARQTRATVADTLCWTWIFGWLTVAAFSGVAYSPDAFWTDNWFFGLSVGLPYIGGLLTNLCLAWLGFVALRYRMVARVGANESRAPEATNVPLPLRATFWGLVFETLGTFLILDFALLVGLIFWNALLGAYSPMDMGFAFLRTLVMPPLAAWPMLPAGLVLMHEGHLATQGIGFLRMVEQPEAGEKTRFFFWLWMGFWALYLLLHAGAEAEDVFAFGQEHLYLDATCYLVFFGETLNSIWVAWLGIITLRQHVYQKQFMAAIHRRLNEEAE